ncbi:hypothetical protein Tco_0837256, partial [Tanacetum coccineum]
MENPNHLNEPNEAIPEVNPVNPEPNQVVDIHDPNEMVDIPDDIDLVDYDEEGPEEDPEEEPKEDVDIELKDDAELIFPYEMEGDKTSPPGDVSSDYVSSDSESEDKEVDVVPEATAGTITQKPYVIRDFSRGLFEVGESSSARDSSHVDGLAPEKERELLNHDLENVERALGNVLERISVLESGENATLKKRLATTETKLVLARMEFETAERRAIPKPPSDDEDTERPRKKSKNSPPSGTESLLSHMDHLLVELVFWSCIALDGDIIMPPKAMSEARMREVIREQVVASMAEFMANMNRATGGDEAGGAGAGGAGAGGPRAYGAGSDGAGAGGAEAGGARAGGAGAGGAGVGGAGPAATEITGCTYVPFRNCDAQPFKGTEGAVGLCQWFEKLESVFRISDCKERDKVKFPTATLQGRALTWWNGMIASMGIDAANGT